MNALAPTPLAAQPVTAPVTLLDLDTVDAAQMARMLANSPPAARPNLTVDCRSLRCLRTLGVSHVMNQLLLLHQAGARICLRNVDPVLRRCLQLLCIDHLFIVEAS